MARGGGMADESGRETWHSSDRVLDELDRQDERVQNEEDCVERVLR